MGGLARGWPLEKKFSGIVIKLKIAAPAASGWGDYYAHNTSDGFSQLPRQPCKIFGIQMFLLFVHFFVLFFACWLVKIQSSIKMGLALGPGT